LISDLEDGVACTSFLNGLKSRQFKFSLAKDKETTLAEALRKAADFIHTIEICAKSTDAPKKSKAPVDRNAGQVDKSPGLEALDPHFTADPHSTLMGVTSHPMLKRS